MTHFPRGQGLLTFIVSLAVAPALVGIVVATAPAMAASAPPSTTCTYPYGRCGSDANTRVMDGVVTVVSGPGRERFWRAERAPVRLGVFAAAAEAAPGVVDDVLTPRPKFRTGTVDDAWANATPGPKGLLHG